MPNLMEMTHEETVRQLEINAIAQQNDYFRAKPPTEALGKWVCTQAIHAEGPEFVRDCFRAAAEYDSFDEDNDPYGTREMGFMDVQGKKVWWKIDLYNRSYDAGSENPTALAETRRVLTMLFPSEY